MEKKNIYQKPEVTVVEVELQCMLNSSPDEQTFDINDEEWNNEFE